MNGLFVCAVAIKDDDYLVRCMAVPVDELVNQELACSGKILRSKSLKRRISFNYVVAIDQDIASHCVCYPFCCWIVYLDKIGYPGINVNIKSHSFVFCERSAGGVAGGGGGGGARGGGDLAPAPNSAQGSGMSVSSAQVTTSTETWY